MDLSFSLTAGQQWLLLVALCFSLVPICFMVANWYINRENYKANWTTRLQQFKKG